MNTLKQITCLLVLCFLFCIVQVTRAAEPSPKELKKMVKDMAELTSKVKELNDNVKLLTSRLDRYEQQNDKSVFDVRKTTTKEITEMANALKKCCGTYKPKERTLTISADDKAFLYLDGEEITLVHAEDWDVPDTVLLPKDTKVIAVMGINHKGDAGIVASTDDGFVITNSSWKCARKKSFGWEGLDFDDSDWPPASYSKPYYEKPITGIRGDSQWIWTDNFSGKQNDKSVYCRLTLKKPK